MTSNANSIRIVIADDHPLFRFGLRKFLEAQSDLTVVGEAQDGHQALAVVESGGVDVLLLDLAMPRLPGLDTLRELMESKNEVRTILLTAAVEKDQIAQALQLGARGVVLKDSATEVLLKAIRAVHVGQFWVGRESVGNLVDILRSLLFPEPGKGPAAKTYGLTPREMEIISAIVTGSTNRDIARQFSISEITVKHHLSNIFDKLGVSNRLELALFAINKSLVARF